MITQAETANSITTRGVRLVCSFCKTDLPGSDHQGRKVSHGACRPLCGAAKAMGWEDLVHPVQVPLQPQPPQKRWASFAKWPPGHIYGCDDTTTDKHETREQAEAVCLMLRRDGFGGERCHFPQRTWVEEVA